MIVVDDTVAVEQQCPPTVPAWLHGTLQKLQIARFSGTALVITQSYLAKHPLSV
jgi:hypothetical protein